MFVCFWIQKTKGKSSESLIPKALLFLEMGAILFDLIAVYTYGKSKALVALDYVLTGRFSLAYRMFDYVGPYLEQIYKQSNYHFLWIIVYGM